MSTTGIATPRWTQRAIAHCSEGCRRTPWARHKTAL